VRENIAAKLIAAVVICVVSVGTTVVVLRSQPKPPVAPPDKVSRLKLDIERDRRLWWATQAQYETTITDQQRQLLGTIQQQTQKVQMKIKELDGYLGCESRKQILDEDLLECKVPVGPGLLSGKDK
jgi:hypothetical protein